MEVLHYLTDSEHRHEFRDLSAPIWVSPKRLDIVASTARLMHHSKDTLGRFYCPVIHCKKSYKYHSRLGRHLLKHEEFHRLPADSRDQVMNDLTFDVLPDSGLRSTVLSPEVYASMQSSGALQHSSVS